MKQYMALYMHQLVVATIAYFIAITTVALVKAEELAVRSCKAMHATVD
jgi:hypothetical protein